MKLAWLTDIHLNVLRAEARQSFCSVVLEAGIDGLLISGDISEGPDLVAQLRELDEALRMPIYFVLGNHDFYRSSIADVQAAMRTLELPRLTWLTGTDVVSLSSNTALIGDDGWADGRCGNYYGSQILLNDYFLIREFFGLNRHERLRMLNRLGDAAADRLRGKLNIACHQHQGVILLTHVPPFDEACWHEGRISEPDWLPHFASKAVGDAIVEVMDQHPASQLTVLCGHTHGAGIAHIRPNVLVKTGGAEYGKPAIQEIIGVY